jgi:hypothetical protein
MSAAAMAANNVTQQVDFDTSPQKGLAEGVMGGFASILDTKPQEFQDKGPQQTADTGAESVKKVAKAPDKIETGKLDKGAGKKAEQNENRGQQVEQAMRERTAQLKNAGPDKAQNTKMNMPKGGTEAGPSVTGKAGSIVTRAGFDAAAIGLAGAVGGPGMATAVALVSGAGQLAGVAKAWQPSTEDYKTSFDSEKGKGKRHYVRQTGPSEIEVSKRQEMSRGAGGGTSSQMKSGGTNSTVTRDDAANVGMFLKDEQTKGLNVDPQDPALASLENTKKEVENYRNDLKRYVHKGIQISKDGELSKDSLQDASETQEIDLGQQLDSAPDKENIVVHHTVKGISP